MTPEQFKMAKAALGLSNPELAEATGLHRNTLNKLDKGEGKASTVQHVRLALEAQGVQFLEAGDEAQGTGVALNHPGGGSGGGDADSGQPEVPKPGGARAKRNAGEPEAEALGDGSVQNAAGV